MSVYTAPKERTRQQYVATSSFVNNFYTYTTSLNTSNLVTTGSFGSVSGAAASNCPAGRILRENGRKLYSNADPGVSTFMVGVVDSVTGLSGFIDPNASLFQPYSGARAADLADGLDYSVSAAGSNHRGGSVYTWGNVVAGSQLQSGAGTIALSSSNIGTQLATGQYFSYTMGAATTFTASNAIPAGTTVWLTLTGAYAGTLGAGFKTTAAAPTPVTTGSVTLGFVSDGSNLREFARSSNLV